MPESSRHENYTTLILKCKSDLKQCPTTVTKHALGGKGLTDNYQSARGVLSRALWLANSNTRGSQSELLNAQCNQWSVRRRCSNIDTHLCIKSLEICLSDFSHKFWASEFSDNAPSICFSDCVSYIICCSTYFTLMIHRPSMIDRQ